MSELPRSPYGQFLLERPTGEEGIASEVFLEPLDTDLIFLPPASQRLLTPLAYVFVDPYLAVRTGRFTKGRPALHRRVGRPDAPPGSSFSSERCGLATKQGSFTSRCRRLSRRFPSARSRGRSGRRIDTGVGFRSGELCRKRVRVHPQYTTAPRVRIRWKTFYSRLEAGHCEFFATAMVMILRVRGVPARIVTGFLGGELNDIGNFEVVRKEDPHAWVEVLDQQRGWISFDPTPPALGGNETRTFEFVAKSIDSLSDAVGHVRHHVRLRGATRGS